jgi:hypothetical protein
MNWDYISGFFDGEGNLHISISKKNYEHSAYQLMIRLYSSDDKVLLKIKEFLGFGYIYLKKASGVYELTITKKKDVLTFLMNIKDKVILKKSQTEFILQNYSFERKNNALFDLDTFRSFITRKNVIRKNHTIKGLLIVK